MTARAVRTPSEIRTEPLTDLCQQLVEARDRILLARHTSAYELDLEDCWTAVVHGTHIAADVTAWRWGLIAELLRHGAVESWTQVGQAVDMTEIDTRDAFLAWIDHQSNRGGLTDADADALWHLAEGVRR